MLGEAYFGSCNDNMCNTKIILDTDIFRDIKYGMEVMVHEYGHIFNSLIRNKQNNNFDARKYMISSLANGTKINNKSYQKLLSYGIVRSWYRRTSYIDLFPEAFGRWIMTPEQNRDLGWEKLDKFFRIDLLKLL
ncbi:hypothetical protein [Spiroplasma endosymbiont of Zeiraphera isertana]|uniref:hypothetical protein n=1 Tax=Spiroplasma endosymbiont of Zeiraphera isertana TaxID=3066313 RepID=UPI00313E1696